MITRDALYSFVQGLIDSAADDTPLKGAENFRDLRSSVDEADKVIRIEVFTGEHAMTDEAKRKELGVTFTIQCWVLPEDDSQAAIDTAADESFEMSRAIYEGIEGTSLGGLVCDCSTGEFETGEANLGTIRRGVTYLDGVINRVS